MKKFATLKIGVISAFIFLLFCSGSRTQEIKPVFGVAFGYNNMNEFYHLVAYQQMGANLINKQIIRRDQFIYYFSGYYPSKYNPGRINYFEKYNIMGGVFVDTLTNQKIPFCPALDSLWKIRYHEYPVKGGMEKDGWSNDDLHPNGPQMQYLKERYNIKDITNEYILGDYFIQLLKDMTDSLWIEEYRRM